MVWRTGKMIAVAASLACLTLAACAIDTETEFLTDPRITLRTESLEKSIPTASVTAPVIWDIAREYSRFGSGPVELTVTYDPQSSKNTVKKAQAEASRIAAGLRKLWVQTVQGTTLPVNNQGDESRIVVSYSATRAIAPDGCRYMGGVGDAPTDIEGLDDYRYGCTTAMLRALQTARPKDLAGNAGLGRTEFGGRRGYYTLGNYQTGKTNPPLVGESSSKSP